MRRDALETASGHWPPIASAGLADPDYRCLACGHRWPKEVRRWWPVRVRLFLRPGPARPVWTVARWGIEETGHEQPYQRQFSTVFKVGPLIVHFGRGERRR